MTHKPTNTAEYLAALPEPQRKTLTRMQKVIRAAAPGAEEGFSYGMPALTVGGKGLIWFAAWKNHYSLYPIGLAILEAHAAAVEGYETAKGTIRFPAAEPIPNELVTQLVKARVAEFDARGK